MSKKYLILLVLITFCLFFLIKKYYVFIKPGILDLVNEIKPHKEFKRESDLIFQFAFKNELNTESIYRNIILNLNIITQNNSR